MAGVIGLILMQAMLKAQPVLAATPSKPAAVARDARLGGDEKRTRFIADLSHRVDYRVFTLANSYRVIIDLPEVKFRFARGQGQKGRGLVSAFRYGLFGHGKSRIVIDVTAPVEIAKTHIVEAQNSQPLRLIVDLKRISPEKFLNLQKRSRAALRNSEPGNDRAGKNNRVAALKKPTGGKPAKTSMALPVVIIDAGHGGIDPGAISPNGTREKDIVFDFSRELAKQMAKYKSYRAIMTRKIDTFMPLQDRVKFASKHDGALFISVHADTVSKQYRSGARGAVIYTLDEEGSDELSKQLAAKENRSDIVAGLDIPPEMDNQVQNILIDLAQRETNNLSISFANALVGKLRRNIKLNRKPVRGANFLVLRNADVPSVLFELGFLSNKLDEKSLKSKKWRKKVARALARAVDRYFQTRVARSPFLP